MVFRIAYELREGIIPTNEEFDCDYIAFSSGQIFTIRTSKKLDEAFRRGIEQGMNYIKLERITDSFNEKFYDELGKGNYCGTVILEVA